MNEDYKVLPPGDPLYESALAEFWNYVLSIPPNPDDEPSSQPGNIFFVRAHKTPIIKVGIRGVTVRENQKVFLPLMVSVADSQNSNATTIQERRGIVRREQDQSEPPQQMTATIDKKSIFATRNAADFYVETDDFTLSVPRDTPYSDPRMSDLDEVYSYQGDFQAIANGIAVIIYDLKPNKEPYRLVIDAVGRGDYRATAFYDIKVLADGEEETRQFNLEDTFKDMLQAKSISLPERDKTAWIDCAKAADSLRRTKYMDKLRKTANILGLSLSEKVSNIKK